MIVYGCVAPISEDVSKGAREGRKIRAAITQIENISPQRPRLPIEHVRFAASGDEIILRRDRSLPVPIPQEFDQPCLGAADTETVDEMENFQLAGRILARR